MYNGELVKLREYRKEDAVRALSFVNNPEVSRLLSTGAPFPFTLWDEEKWVESNSARKHESYNFAIETLSDGLFIGGCGLNKLDWKNSSATVGIMIGDPVYWGRGYGTDAMRVLLRFLFEQLNMHRVDLHVFAFNERARRSYAKVGFVEEGMLRESLYLDGKWHSQHVMSMLRSEFDALYGKKG